MTSFFIDKSLLNHATIVWFSLYKKGTTILVVPSCSFHYSAFAEDVALGVSDGIAVADALGDALVSSVEVEVVAFAVAEGLGIADAPGMTESFSILQPTKVPEAIVNASTPSNNLLFINFPPYENHIILTDENRLLSV